MEGGKKKRGMNKGVRAMHARRLRNIELTKEMMLQGTHNKSQMAAALGVARSTIDNYVARVEKSWADDLTLEEQNRRRGLRIRQISSLVEKHLADYARSRRHRCKKCGGTGTADNGKWCPACDGEGSTEEQGDQQCLEGARRCMVEIAKLEGLYAAGEKTPVVEDHKHLHLHAGEKVRPLQHLSGDAILEMMSRLHEMGGAADGRVIDVEGYNREGRIEPEKEDGR